MLVSPDTAAPSLFAGYGSELGRFDEARDASGEWRPAWRQMAAGMGNITADEFARRWTAAQRQLDQNTLAYQHSGPGTPTPRPWRLDALPLVIQAAEWQTVEAALQQRAKLLDLIMRDLFGPQTLLQKNWLSAELVYRHPGFHLPLARSEQRWLNFYSADIARAPDGKWWVLADRSDAPSGAGFALENRLVMSRMLPEVLRKTPVKRLAPYFAAVRQQLARLNPNEPSPDKTADPRIMFLTNEAGTSHYFEDAFLARYLGYTLVEPGDLAVRGNRVFLKTLGGLVPVDVLLRRTNTAASDPLELGDAATTLAAPGITGLVHASRKRTVAMANPLGSGLIESPAFLAFLPRLCEQLLGEPLAMPNVATWWCGQQKHLAYVLNHLDKLIILPAYRVRGESRVRARQLAKLSIDERRKAILAAPYKYVGQEVVERSTAPVWEENRAAPAPIALRTYAVAQTQPSGEPSRDDQANYLLMPGGLARVTRSTDPLDSSLAAGERSKDTWVLAEGPVSPMTLLGRDKEKVIARRRDADLPSSVAERFFWLGRYAERGEAAARLVRTIAQRFASDQDTGQLPELPALLWALAESGQIEPGFVVDEIRQQLPAIESTLPAAVFDNTAIGSLRSIVSSLVGLGSKVRDRMSLDAWRVLRQMDETFWPAKNEADGLSSGLSDLLEKIDALLMSFSALAGLVTEGMTRTSAWRFLELGRRLERGVQTADLVRAMLRPPIKPNSETLQALLEAADSSMTYRSRYHGPVQLAPVLDLLLTDDTNPRGLSLQVADCQQQVGLLPRDDETTAATVEQQLVTTLVDRLNNTDSEHIAKAHTVGNSKPLIELLDEVEEQLKQLSDAVSHKYLIHAGPLHRLTNTEPS